MLKKILLLPWFGPFPSWLDQWVANMEYLKPMGYDYKIYSNLDLFKERIVEVLGINPVIESGTGKVWDYRPALGLLFSEDIKGYDYWGHTDFDCVYGNVEKFIPDSFLKNVDIYGNHYDYISGPWSLYRNCKEVNNAFKLHPRWKVYMESPVATSWSESEFSTIAQQHLRVKYLCQQTKDWNNFDTLKLVDGSLYEGDDEVMMAHFRRTKVWPTQIKL